MQTTNSLNQETTAINLNEQRIQSSIRGFSRIQLFVEGYNKDGGIPVLVSESIITALKNEGAVNDVILRSLTETDLARITGLSTIVARALHGELKRTDDTPVNDPIKRIPTRLGVQSFALEELVKRYDPLDLGSAITGELRRRIKDALGTDKDPRVIVFNDEGKVLIDSSLLLIKEAMQGDPDLSAFPVQGVSRVTYRVGEYPQQIVSLHPISGEYLRSNGLGKDGLNWAETQLDCRQMLHLAVKSGELSSKLERRDLVYYHNQASQVAGLSQLQSEFPEASQRYLEAKALGNLPLLKAFRRSRREQEVDPAQMIKTTRHS